MSRDKIRGFKERRCAECHAAERAQERREMIEAGYVKEAEVVQLELFERAA